MVHVFLLFWSQSEIDLDRVRHVVMEKAVSEEDISSGDAKGELLSSWVAGSNLTRFNFFLLGISSINSGSL